MLLRYRPLALVLLIPLPALAQGLPPLDAYSAGGTRSDVGEDVAVDGAGSVYVTGSFEGTASFGGLTLTAADTDPNADWQDVFVVKYDVEGAALWARRAGTGVFNDFAEGIAVSPFGDVYVAGYFTGVATWDGGDNPDVTLTTRNDFDAFLARYDTDGNLAWVAQAGGNGQDTGRGVAVTNSGDVYFAGGFYETATFGTNTTLTSAGSDDAFLAKYDANGSLLWAQRGGGTDGDGAWNVATDLGGNAFVVGTFRGVALFGALPLQSRGFSDLFAVKYNPGGTVAWVQQIGAGGFDYGRGVASTLEAGAALYVTGSFENTILVNQDVLTSAGFSDVVVARIDPLTGALRWGVRGGGGGFDIGNDLALVPTYVGAMTLSVHTTGYVDGDGTFSKGPRALGYLSHGGLDGFVLTLNDRVGSASPLPDAAVRTLGGANADRGWGIGASDVGATLAGVAVTGAFRDQARIGPEVLTSAGSNDVYVGRLLFRPPSLRPAGEGEEGSDVFPVAGVEGPARLSLAAPSPNPFRDAVGLTLTLPAAQPIRAEVYDGLGRRVALLHDGPLDAGTHALTWAAGTAPPGVYLVRVVTAEGTRTRRLTRLL
jgi:hypothetical protein